MGKRSQVFCVSVVIALSLIAIPGGFSQDKYPNRPITLLIPMPPGNNSELAFRLIAKEAEKFETFKIYSV